MQANRPLPATGRIAPLTDFWGEWPATRKIRRPADGRAESSELMVTRHHSNLDLLKVRDPPRPRQPPENYFSRACRDNLAAARIFRHEPLLDHKRDLNWDQRRLIAVEVCDPVGLITHLRTFGEREFARSCGDCDSSSPLHIQRDFGFFPGAPLNRDHFVLQWRPGPGVENGNGNCVRHPGQRLAMSSLTKNEARNQEQGAPKESHRERV